VTPDGSHVYAAGFNDDALAGFSRDGATGVLSFVEALRGPAGEIDGLNGAHGLAVSPNGGHLYVAGRVDDGLAVFAQDPNTGALSFVEVVRNGVGGIEGLDSVRAVALSPNGSHVYAAAANDDAVSVFARDGATGELSLIELHRDGINGVDGLDEVVSITVSPDGAHVYAAGSLDNAIAVFSRDTNSGQLVFVEVVRDGISGVDGLESVRAVALSSDGKHLYAAGFNDDAVAVFSRDGSTGSLSLIEVVRDGAGGVDGLDGAIDVTLAPDGDHVYVAARVDDALAVFARDSGDGRLSFVEIADNGVGGVTGLDSVRSVTLSPDGNLVVAAAFNEDGLAIFERDPTSGRLNFLEVARDGLNGVAGLRGALAVASDPNGLFIYSAGFEDDALVQFALDSDRDGTPDVDDAFPQDPNEQLDSDGDGTGDKADPDDDDDGMPDSFERRFGLDPLDASDADDDPDGDGSTNLEEYQAGTNPLGPGTIPVLLEWLPLLFQR